LKKRLKELLKFWKTIKEDFMALVKEFERGNVKHG
jgi:hypothetical protein